MKTLVRAEKWHENENKQLNIKKKKREILAKNNENWTAKYRNKKLPKKRDKKIAKKNKDKKIARKKYKDKLTAGSPAVIYWILYRGYWRTTQFRDLV